MPAFTFEKISSPVRASAPDSAQVVSKTGSAGKSRTLITSMLDRLAIARLKREQAKLPPTLPKKPPPE